MQYTDDVVELNHSPLGACSNKHVEGEAHSPTSAFSF